MPDPFPPDPDERRPRGPHPSLSAHERRALRLIEDDLARDDPGFTQRMRRGEDHVSVALPQRRRSLVVAAVVGLIILLVAVPSSWWVLYVLLALMGVSAWVLVRMTRSGPPPDSAP